MKPGILLSLAVASLIALPQLNAQGKLYVTNAASALIEQGLIRLTRMNDYENALDVLIKALEITDSVKFVKERTLIYLTMSRIFEQVGDSFKSLDYQNQAYALNDVK